MLWGHVSKGDCSTLKNRSLLQHNLFLALDISRKKRIISIIVFENWSNSIYIAPNNEINLLFLLASDKLKMALEEGLVVSFGFDEGFEIKPMGFVKGSFECRTQC